MLITIFIVIIFVAIIGISSYNPQTDKRIMMFPGSIFAGMLNFQPFPGLGNTVEERRNINAKDLFNN